MRGGRSLEVARAGRSTLTLTSDAGQIEDPSAICNLQFAPPTAPPRTAHHPTAHHPGRIIDSVTSLFLHRLRRNRRFRSIWITVIAICVASAVAALGVRTMTLRNETPLERAERLSDAGDFAGAERVYWSILDQGPVEMEVLLGLIDNRAELLYHGAGFDEGDSREIDRSALGGTDILARLDRDDVSAET